MDKLENQAILEKTLRENPLYKDINGNTSLGKCIEILSALPKMPSEKVEWKDWDQWKEIFDNISPGELGESED